MNWEKVGDWVQSNAGTGVSLVGSLLTGNVPGAVAAGVAMVSSATGTDDPTQALIKLQGNPDTMLKLKELYYANEADVRQHLQEMTKLKLEDKQREHETTQKTIQEGDKAEDWFVRRTRPAQSWCSLFAAFGYVGWSKEIDILVLTALLTLPFAYAGLREVGKGITAFTRPAA